MRRFRTALLVLAVLAVPVPSGAQAGAGRYGYTRGLVPSGAQGAGRYGYTRGLVHFGGPYHGGYGYFRTPRVLVGLGPLVWWGAPHALGPVVHPATVPIPAPPRVVVVAPAVPVQRPLPRTAYWFWCESERGYFPSVPRCPGAWVVVPPRS